MPYINKPIAYEEGTFACQTVLSSYNAKTASVSEAQTYATCVQSTYPRPWTSGETLLAKACIISALVGACICAVVASRRGYNDVVEIGTHAVMGGVLGTLTLLLLFGVYSAIGFLFS